MFTSLLELEILSSSSLKMKMSAEATQRRASSKCHVTGEPKTRAMSQTCSKHHKSLWQAWAFQKRGQMFFTQRDKFCSLGHRLNYRLVYPSLQEYNTQPRMHATLFLEIYRQNNLLLNVISVFDQLFICFQFKEQKQPLWENLERGIGDGVEITIDIYTFAPNGCKSMNQQCEDQAGKNLTVRIQTILKEKTSKQSGGKGEAIQQHNALVLGSSRGRKHFSSTSKLSYMRVHWYQLA